MQPVGESLSRTGANSLPLSSNLALGPHLEPIGICERLLLHHFTQLGLKTAGAAAGR
jgi:hypothetical protein